jgi:hypothetical protein
MQKQPGLKAKVKASGRTVELVDLSNWNEGRQGRELYDHDSDPRQQRNLINDPRYAKIVVEIKQLLQ